MSYEVVLPEKDAEKLAGTGGAAESVELLVKEKTGWALRKKAAKAIVVAKDKAHELFLKGNVRVLRWKA